MRARDDGLDGAGGAAGDGQPEGTEGQLPRRPSRPRPADDMSDAARELLRESARRRRDEPASAPPPGIPARAPLVPLATVMLPGGERWALGAGVLRAARTRPYQPRPWDPSYRALRVALDAAADDPAAVAIARIPWEPLDPGPRGATLEVTGDGAPLDLEEPALVNNAGLPASTADPGFARQTLYAVASATYDRWRAALGREPAWGFDGGPAEALARLRLRMDTAVPQGARYDAVDGEVAFGVPAASERALGHARLAHDLVAHEVTHAVLAGLRAHFAAPTNPDVLALHEAIANLVAILQRLTYAEAARAAIRTASAGTPALPELARRVARNADPLGAMDAERAYDPSLPPHALGGVLTSAVLDAFSATWARRVAWAGPLLAEAARTGTRADGPLLEPLAREARVAAARVLEMCLRAMDYCPPVDVTFADFLRAAITADREVDPEDPWGVRPALVAACARRGIGPSDVGLDEAALAWPTAARLSDALPGLDYGSLQFAGDPARAPGTDELERQAMVLARMVANPASCHLYGLADPARPDDRERLEGDEVSAPCVESVRAARRAGMSGRVVFDFVAEVTQRRIVRDARGVPEFELLGGATVILAPTGEVRHIVAKSVLQRARIEQQRAWLHGPGREHWHEDAWGVLRPVSHPFDRVHEAARGVLLHETALWSSTVTQF